ncbi:uncharacterized protein LOC134532647 [Bacillus rossius redtenbacheri]|uniref:uncharacterized protein LOC134532647 n=1 Tax=Bacillus rossius redtenbacheri TaxID=93214 RepID=UPI002FDDA58D
MSFNTIIPWMPNLLQSMGRGAFPGFTRLCLLSGCVPLLHEVGVLRNVQSARSLKVSGIRTCGSSSQAARGRLPTAVTFPAWKSRDVKRRTSFSTASPSEPLTKLQAQDLILRLTDEERRILLSALQEFHSEKMKAEFEGDLAGVTWRSRFGRPSKLPGLGEVDVTGAYCLVPEEWLKRKYAEAVPPPTARDLWQVSIHNAVPFVGFGFLDNFFMILAGEYIEATIGSLVVISTMTAAALGNTISDIAGIGSAWYVERLAARVGIRAPKLTPLQLDLHVTRRSANLGRVIGVSLGCILGMSPLLFLSKSGSSDQETIAT